MSDRPDFSDFPNFPFSSRPNRRRFVAEKTALAEEPPFDALDLGGGLMAGESADDDLPLLTEVVNLDALLPPALSADDVDSLVARVEASLRAQLPALLAAAISALEDDLKRGVSALVEDALRDALNDYLPFPLPDEEDSPGS